MILPAINVVSDDGLSQQVDVELKKIFESLFAYGKSIAEKYQFTEEDVNEEIKKYREEKRKRNKHRVD